jgi:methyl-accepting chemotaxis protein
MTKEEIQKNSEHWYEKYKEVKHELEQERKLNAEIKLLGERCNQLLKDKGDLTDRIDNQTVAYETLKLHDQEEIGMLNSKVEELEQQIKKMKRDVKQEQSHWNSCEMQYDLYRRLLEKWGEK